MFTQRVASSDPGIVGTPLRSRHCHATRHCRSRSFLVLAGRIRRARQYIKRKDLQKQSQKEYLRFFYQAADRIEDGTLVYRLEEDDAKNRVARQQEEEMAHLNKALRKQIAKLDTVQAVDELLQEHGSILNYINLSKLPLRLSLVMVEQELEEADMVVAASVLDRLAALLSDKFSWFQPQHFSWTAVGMAGCGYRDAAFWRLFVQSCERKVMAMTMGQLTAVLVSLTQVHYVPHKMWLAASERQAAKHLDRGTGAHLCDLMYAWGALGFSPRQKSLMNSVKDRLRRMFKAHELEGDSLVRLLRGMALLERSTPPEQWLLAWTNELRPYFPQTSPHDLVLVLVDLVQLGYQPRERWLLQLLMKVNTAFISGWRRLQEDGGSVAGMVETSTTIGTMRSSAVENRKSGVDGNGSMNSLRPTAQENTLQEAPASQEGGSFSTDLPLTLSVARGRPADMGGGIGGCGVVKGSYRLPVGEGRKVVSILGLYEPEGAAWAKSEFVGEPVPETQPVRVQLGRRGKEAEVDDLDEGIPQDDEEDVDYYDDTLLGEVREVSGMIHGDHNPLKGQPELPKARVSPPGVDQVLSTEIDSAASTDGVDVGPDRKAHSVVPLASEALVVAKGAEATNMGVFEEPLAPRLLALLGWCLFRLDYLPPSWWMCRYLDEVYRQLDVLEGHHLVDILNSLAGIDFVPDDKFMQGFTARLLPCLAQLPPTALATVMRGLVKMGYGPESSWLDVYLDQVDRVMSDMTGDELSDVLAGLGYLQYPPSPAWMQRYERELLAVVDERKEEVGTAKGLPRPPSADEDSSPSCTDLLPGVKLGQLSPGCVANLLLAFAQLQYKPPPSWLHCCLVVAKDKMKRMAIRDLPQLGWALATLRHRPSSSWLQHYLTCLDHRVRYLSPQGLADVLWSLATFKEEVAERWLQQLDEVLQVHAEGLDPGNTAVVVWSLSQLGYVPRSHTARKALEQNLTRGLLDELTEEQSHPEGGGRVRPAASTSKRWQLVPRARA